ncbi:MAG: aldo/keto reductase [Acidobacteria bacterium]|nr:aldo/keto reductase [Acidobacteriota bacterium]MBI3280509.1 aldo/keto reductase [Acidobacteriota bacterium]
METRQFENTDLTVSRVCLGTMTFGSQTDIATAGRIVDLCFDGGVNFFDTANVYNGGESERVLAEVLGRRRQDAIIASKVGMKVGGHPAGLKRELILAAAEDTLRRLKTDYLDIYYLHLPDWSTPIEESLAAMDTLVRQGKVRYLGSSNYASWQICQMLCFAEKNGYRPARIAQPMYNLLARRIEDEFLPCCREFGVSTVVYNPLAGGLLTGKHNPEMPLAGTRFDGNQTYLDRYWNHVNFEAISHLATIASADGRSLISLALNWLLHHTPADCVILGASRLEQIEENLRALDDGPLEAAAVSACDAVWTGLKGPGPKYNR